MTEQKASAERELRAHQQAPKSATQNEKPAKLTSGTPSSSLGMCCKPEKVAEEKTESKGTFFGNPYTYAKS